MRQDAVMEQVFQLVNNVLSRDRETRRRDLNIRCYKVIPLTSQAGVLEFVGNTLPLKDWLIRAHPRFASMVVYGNVSTQSSALDTGPKICLSTKLASCFAKSKMS